MMGIAKFWVGLSLLWGLYAHAAAPLGIYGEDDRKELYESSDLRAQEWARSTAAIFSASSFTASKGGNLELKGSSATDHPSINLCQDERFSSQPVAAGCSGFLVGKDLLLSAGHCFKIPFDCRRARIAFGWGYERKGVLKELSSTDMYSCKEILWSAISHTTVGDSVRDVDFSVIRLDREVSDRAPLKMSTESSIPAVGTGLVMLGHPLGLPLKVATGKTTQRRLEDGRLTTDLDAFAGNSGSPVLNTATGEVLGLLVSGRPDLVRDEKLWCNRVVRRPDGEAGESVNRIFSALEQAPAEVRRLLGVP